MTLLDIKGAMLFTVRGFGHAFFIGRQGHMKQFYFNRELDKAGRVTIPVDVRLYLDLKPKDTLIFTLDADNDVIYLKKREETSPEKRRK